MDFLQAGVKVAHLLKDEISHELVIRKLPVNPLARRTSLCSTLKQTAALARRGSLKFSDIQSSDVTSELDICQRKVYDVEEELRDGVLTAAAAARLSSRCRYLLCRLSRLAEETEPILSLKDKVKAMLSRLKDHTTSPSGSDSDDNEGESSDNCRIIKKIIYKSDSHFNVNSLNLKFTGDTCVRSFLTRLEELRIARGVAEDRIFCGFPELLEGPALSWFRSNRSNFTSYRDVTAAIKEEFDIPDLDL